MFARVRALAGRILLSTAGRTRWQPAYRWAHDRALRGRNYGRSAVEESGERHALTYAHDRLPDARVLLDVGANRGTWSLEARGLWPTAQIHAFEPSLRVHGELVAATAGAASRASAPPAATSPARPTCTPSTGWTSSRPCTSGTWRRTACR